MASVYTTNRGKDKKQKHQVSGGMKVKVTVDKKPKANKQFKKKKVTAASVGLLTGVGSDERKVNISSSSAPVDTTPSYYRCFSATCGSQDLVHTFSTCTGCNIARYCSRDCQKKDWKAVHKATCKDATPVLTKGCSIAVRCGTPGLPEIKISKLDEVSSDEEEEEDDEEEININVPVRNKRAEAAAERHGVLASHNPADEEVLLVKDGQVYFRLYDFALRRTEQFIKVPVTSVIVTEWKLE